MTSYTHKICTNPENKHLTTPMIFTFAFRGYEYWCPICGWKTGMLGAKVEMQENTEMILIENAYKERALPFLKYMSSLNGGMVKDENGKLIPANDPKVDYEYGVFLDIHAKEKK